MGEPNAICHRWPDPPTRTDGGARARASSKAPRWCQAVLPSAISSDSRISYSTLITSNHAASQAISWSSGFLAALCAVPCPVLPVADLGLTMSAVHATPHLAIQPGT